MAPVQPTDNRDFLRASDIRLRIDHDVRANLDHAIALINRPGPLNFTGNRLPEEPAAARAALIAQLDEFTVCAGLVRTADRYGDHGIVGFFFVTGRSGQAELRHFCFSRRVLDLGVERFMYRRLGRPGLKVAGPVACDPTAEDGEIDWISCDDGAAPPGPAVEAKLLDRLVLRGGCDLSAMLHYLGPLADTVHAELNTARDGRQFRIDNAMLLNLALREPSPEAQAALREIGYIPSDWQSALALPPQAGSRTVWIVSFWTDAFVYLYKHKALDLAVPFLLEIDPHADTDVTVLPQEQLDQVLTTAANRQAHAALRRDFWGIGPIFRELLEDALAQLLEAARGRAMLIILLPPERWRDPRLELHERPLEARANGWIRAAVAGAPDVHAVEFSQFVGPEDVSEQIFHFGRLVYARAAAHLVKLIQARFAPRASAFQATGW